MHHHLVSDCGCVTEWLEALQEVTDATPTAKAQPVHARNTYVFGWLMDIVHLCWLVGGYTSCQNEVQRKKASDQNAIDNYSLVISFLSVYGKQAFIGKRK